MESDFPFLYLFSFFFRFVLFCSISFIAAHKDELGCHDCTERNN